MKASLDKVVLPSEIFYTLYVGTSGKPLVKKLKLTVDKESYQKVKPPFVLLINHSSSDNIKLAAACLFPQKFNFIANPDDVSSNQLTNRYLGVIPLKRTISTDKTADKLENLDLIKQVVDAGGSIAIFAEYNISVDGTPSAADPSVAWLIRKLRLPVCLLTIKGSYLNKPAFAKNERGASGSVAVLSNLFSADEVKFQSEEDILVAISKALNYSDFEFQRENQITLSGNHLAEGLENILFRCPKCGAEFHISTNKNSIKCSECENVWEIGRFGVFNSTANVSSITNVPSWYSMQRKKVRGELGGGSYSLSGNCRLVIEDAQGDTTTGKGSFSHSNESFVYEGTLDGSNVRMTFKNTDRFILQFMPGKYIGFIFGGSFYRFETDKPEYLAKINLAIEEAQSMVEDDKDNQQK